LQGGLPPCEQHSVYHKRKRYLLWLSQRMMMVNQAWAGTTHTCCAYSYLHPRCVYAFTAGQPSTVLPKVHDIPMLFRRVWSAVPPRSPPPPPHTQTDEPRSLSTLDCSATHRCEPSCLHVSTWTHLTWLLWCLISIAEAGPGPRPACDVQPPATWWFCNAVLQAQQRSILEHAAVRSVHGRQCGWNAATSGVGMRQASALGGGGATRSGVVLVMKKPCPHVSQRHGMKSLCSTSTGLSAFSHT
jgi:hypothetical protein